jgi:hypothetical protein
MATHGLPTWPWAGTPADDLPRTERLLLDGMRLWKQAARACQPAMPVLRPPFVAEDAAAAIPALDALMRTALPQVDLPCLLCPRVAPIEAMLLVGCALTQRGSRREALALFLHHLPPMAAYGAMAAAIPLGIALRRAGLLMSNPFQCR